MILDPFERVPYQNGKHSHGVANNLLFVGDHAIYYDFDLNYN